MIDSGVPAYAPGRCNIGPAEIARRRRAAIAQSVVTAALVVGLLLIGAPPLVRLLVALPLAASLVTWEQVRRRFCVAFGFAGLLNFGPTGTVSTVGDDAARSADRRAALRIVAGASALAAVAAVAFALGPP